VIWENAKRAVDNVRSLIPPRSNPFQGSLGPSFSSVGTGACAGVAGSTVFDTGVGEASEIGGVMARSTVEETVNDPFVRCIPFTVTLELEEGCRRFGSDIIMEVGLFDILEAIAAVRAR